MLLMQTDIWKSLNGTQLFPTKSTSFRFVFTNTLTCYKDPTSLIWADFSFLFGSVNIFKSPFMPKKFASHVVLANASLCFSKILYFCIGFRELSHSTRDLFQAEKKINVVTSWASDKMTTIFNQNDNFNHFVWNRCHFVHCSACNNIYFLLSLR